MLYVRIVWKTNPAKVLNTRVASSQLAEYQTNLGPAWDDIETFTVSSNPIPDAVPTFELHNVDIERGRDFFNQIFTINIFDKDDKKVATARNIGASKLQEFALRILQQTTYAFVDRVEGK